MESSLNEIIEKLDRKEAKVLTSQQVCELVKKGKEIGFEDVDVVTTATRGVMSGTYAVLSFPVKAPEEFTRAVDVHLNGVPAHVGPCPNERLGILDLMVFGTSHSHEIENYGGGHLFRDIVAGKEIKVHVRTDEGHEFRSTVSINDMPFARLFSTRNTFKNYSAFTNLASYPVSTIFHATEFGPDATEATLSGCGEISPVKNDPLLHGIGIGTRILFNGAEGFVLGSGTRSSPQKPNLIAMADMHSMVPEYMGGFITSAGPECIASWAVAIPVVDDSVFEAITQTDSNTPMPVMDADRRVQVATTSYADAWSGVDLEVSFHPSRCVECESCRSKEDCPTEAIFFAKKGVGLDRNLCFNCGLCSTNCPEKVFEANLGSVKFEYEDKSMDIPIVVRQSDRKRALKMADDLKKQIEEGNFKVNGMIERIYS
ncbi:putative methanogenesis marker 16 metalloprotein [Methanohalophilus levihalophilus]|uniref:methanogenesis marker 16 metalloprotein n=1 Tax=Methanohalophilus levihalophilus TaxID=1431282 RepID=UPI001AE59ED4|nr:methanogenesis marker 16 metalloprotein [Methanohalophilus levihalophilus]MBP2030776.1 putative methanogenesis marker 16 metalloprotein [Methanohalophilus levihalophilus]